MALNTVGSQPNPTKALTIALTDTAKAYGNSYTTLLTVLSSQTLKIKDGIFTYNYTGHATDTGMLRIGLAIGSKKVSLYIQEVGANVRTFGSFTLKDKLGSDINLATGDLITIEFTYESAVPATSKLESILLIDDYQA